MSDKITDEIKVESVPPSPPTLSAAQFILDSDDSSDDDYPAGPVSFEASQKEHQMAKLAASLYILKCESKLDKLEAYQNMAMKKVSRLSQLA